MDISLTDTGQAFPQWPDCASIYLSLYILHFSLLVMLAVPQPTYPVSRKDAYPFSRGPTPLLLADIPAQAPQLEVEFRDFRDVAVITLQDILFVLRTASMFFPTFGVFSSLTRDI